MSKGGNKMENKSKTARHLPLLCLFSGLALGGINAALAADANNPALKALFDQANYWHEKSHDELAMESLKKVLMVDANNTQALYLMALWSQQAGDIKGAAQWRARLTAASPQDANLQALDNAKQMQQVPRGQLELARQQARSGNIPAALATWQNLFSGSQPPPSLAPEYYLTMAGDKSLYPQAVSELRQLRVQYPQDNNIKIALGKVLTYQESTRREGIDVLQDLASGSQDADRSLRQALLWLGPQAGDDALYQTYIQRHPNDTGIRDYYRKSIGGAAKGEGFEALNSGNTDTARNQFEQVLQTNPEDADALAGMGYVALRKGDYAAGAQYLNRAASLGGSASEERKQQAVDAEFYGQLAQAQAAYKQGNISQALALSAPLAQRSGEQGAAAKLFRADVQRHNKDYTTAEQTLRGLLTEQPNNGTARENLYYVLREQNKTAEAQAMLQTLPASLQARLQPRVSGGGNPTDPLRRQAQQAVANGDPQRAIALLSQGTARYPADPWLRLDLARLLQKQGRDAEAANAMSPSFRPNASASELYAAALFASENNAWQQSQTLLSRIPASSQNRDMRELSQRVNYNLQMNVAERYLAQGDRAAAANTLKALAMRPPESPADAGKLARMLAQSGDVTSAVSVVRDNMRRGVQGNAGDYADQVTVLNQAGLGSEAQAWLANPELQSRSTPTQLASLRNGYVINDADRLRTQGNYAAAYDKLIRAMQNDPQNTDLMFAMARVYQSGKMNKEAGVVYDYLMTRDTPQQDARAGAINVALANNDVDKAKQLTAGLKNDSTPERLLLLARVSEAEGNHQQAMSYLRTARGRLLGLKDNSGETAPMLGGLALADNPFVGTTRAGDLAPSSSLYGEAMPWQVAQLARNPQTAPPGTVRTDLPVETAQAGTLRQVDNMMEMLVDKTATWARGSTAMRSRDGEEGLSKLTEFKAPLQWSTVPFGDSRLDVNVSPITLDAGSSSDESSRRFGTGALIQGEVAEEVYNASTTTPPELPNLDKIKVPSQGSQSASGVEVAMALTGDQYKIDVGSTPLGQDLNTVVGGVQWSPQLTDYLKLVLVGERRAVVDSLLSYVGVEDKYSGKKWGQVTKNGGSAQLSYDNTDAGFYAGFGVYDYVGENVPSNTSVTGSAGVYFRPYYSDDRELKTGINMSYMNFDKNLSYFSYGQGGYFSPQDYVSVAFPVDYTQKFDNWKLGLGASIGYQSYSQDESPYFPTDAAMQRQLEDYVSRGLAKEYFYSGSSKNGMGYNLRASTDYKLNKDMSIGGQIGYDTFGDYNESTANLYFRYLLGNK